MTLIDQAVMKAFERRAKPSTPAPLAGPLGQPSPVSDRPATQLSPTPGLDDAMSRELYLHAPEALLRGLHQPPNRPVAGPQRPGIAASAAEAPPVAAAAEPRSAVTAMPDERDVSAPTADKIVSSAESVMNSLLSYELAIQGPCLDTWQIATDAPAALETFSPELSSAVESPPPALATAQLASQAFKPAWETDSFRITETCQQVMTQLQDHLQRAAAELMDQCVANRPLINVTGWRSGVGGTTVSILLARALAKAGLRVILVDGDCDNPDLPEHLGVAVEGGWNAERLSLAEIAECCVYSLADGFCFLPQDCPPSATSLLPDLLTRLAEQFDVVLVDAGPRSPAREHWPSELLGAHVIVKDVRRDSDRDIEQLIEDLHARAPGAIRVVENFALVPQI